MPLAQALSHRGRRGRKRDFPDAERLGKRLVAQELVLRFVPDGEQRLWRTGMRGKYQLTRHPARVQNQLEALLEQAHMKLSSLVSDLLRGQCPAHAEGAGRGGSGSRGSGGPGRHALACYAGTVV